LKKRKNNMITTTTIILAFISAATAQTPAAKPETKTPAAKEALAALRTLQSATEIGISYRDYAPRVIDAKTKLDAYLDEPETDDAALRSRLETVMKIFIMAGQAWTDKMATDRVLRGQALDNTDFGALGRAILTDKEISACPGFPKRIEEASAMLRALPTQSLDSSMGVLAAMAGPQIFWTCASSKLEVR
jgi:hypothetical protein